MTAHASQCPECAIGDDGFVIQCGLNGGHKGKHVVVTDRGIAEWPRIEATPLADPPPASEPLADWEREYARAEYLHREHVASLLNRAAKAEAAVERVRGLAEWWGSDGTDAYRAAGIRIIETLDDHNCPAPEASIEADGMPLCRCGHMNDRHVRSLADRCVIKGCTCLVYRPVTA